ncbi:MAG: hypothetical protein F6K31_35375 [Symploca sp. SIO2G7]|nr:hypothetical protein [Symploca sp. SIO2G7]
MLKQSNLITVACCLLPPFTSQFSTGVQDLSGRDFSLAVNKLEEVKSNE